MTKLSFRVLGPDTPRWWTRLVVDSAQRRAATLTTAEVDQVIEQELAHYGARYCHEDYTVRFASESALVMFLLRYGGSDTDDLDDLGFRLELI